MATVDIFSPSVRKERSAMDRIHEEVSRLRRTQTASEMFATRYDRPVAVPSPPPSTDFTDEDMGTIRRNRAAAMQNRREVEILANGRPVMVEQQAIVDELLESVTAWPQVVLDTAEYRTSMSAEQLERMRQGWYTNPIVDAPIMTEQEEREMEEDLANMQTDWPDHTSDGEVW